MIAQRVQAQIKQAIERGDCVLERGSKIIGVSKSVRGERISSLQDHALSEEDRVQWKEFVHKIWYY